MPVMSVEPPRMPTLQPTPLLTSGEEMTSPSSTIAMRRLGSPDGLQAALPVMSAQVSPPLPLKSIATTHSTLCSRWTALAPVISSPWMTVGPTSRVSPWSDGSTWLPSLVGFGLGLGGREDLVDRQLGGGADALLGLLRLLVAGDARQLDEDAVLALAHERRLGDAEGVHAAAEHLRVLSTFSALAGVCSVPSAWKTNCAPPLRSRPRLGLTLIGQRQRTRPGGRARGRSGPRHHVTCATSSTTRLRSPNPGTGRLNGRPARRFRPTATQNLDNTHSGVSTLQQPRCCVDHTRAHLAARHFSGDTHVTTHTSTGRRHPAGHRHRPRRRRARAATAAGATGSASDDDPSDGRWPVTADGDATQIVMVKAPTVEDRNEVIALGLDVTEHADRARHRGRPARRAGRPGPARRRVHRGDVTVKRPRGADRRTARPTRRTPPRWRSPGCPAAVRPTAPTPTTSATSTSSRGPTRR